MSPQSVAQTRRGAALCALFLLGAWAAFFWPILGRGGVPIYRDILHTTFPLGSYVGARLRGGELPQWFPLEGLGEPFIGQLNESTFHPATWLYAVLSPVAALRWQLLLAYAAGAAGQLLYARRLGSSPVAALAAAVIFAFSGYAVSMSNLVPYLWGMATLPWIGLCAAGIAQAAAPGPWVAGLAVSWATVVLAGDSHSALFAGVVVLFTLWVLGGARRLPLAVAAGVLALSVSAAELAPAIGVAAGGPRGQWNRVAMLSTTWALHPYRLPELLFPGWMPEHVGNWIAFDRYRDPLRWAISVYLGLPAVALALVGLLSRTRRGLAAGLLALAALWLALGVHGGLEPLVRRALPLLNALRYPEKHLALWSFGASLAAAAGLDRLRERPDLRFCAGLFACAGALAACGLLLPPDLAARLWPPLSRLPGAGDELRAAWRAGLLASALWLAVLGATLLLARRRPRALWLVPAALFVELWSGAGSAIAVAQPGVLTELPRFCAKALRAGAGPAGLRALDGAVRPAPYRDVASAVRWATLERNLLDPAESSLCGIGSASDAPILSNEPRAVRAMLGTSGLADNPAPAVFGFGLLLRSELPKKPWPGEVLLDAISGPDAAYALALRPAAPRAYAAVPRWVPDAAAAQAELSRGLELVASPALIGAPPAGEVEAPAGPAAPAAAGEVRIDDYAPERVALEARMERAGAVVLNDLFAPGWTATVDGAPARLYAANLLARAVLVPRGAHRIEMRYRLPRLREGLWVSAASLAVCLALALVGQRRGTSRSSPPR